MELQAWPVLKPHRSDLIASLPLMAGVLERIRTGQAISLWEAQDGSPGQMKPDALGSYERGIRRREAKVNWM